MLAGMTIIGGLCGTLLSRFMRQLRPLFPAEVTGTVVAMVGLELVPLSASKFLGIEMSGHRIEPFTVSVASITLLTMVGLSVWGRQTLRLYCALIGVGCPPGRDRLRAVSIDDGARRPREIFLHVPRMKPRPGSLQWNQISDRSLTSRAS